MNLLLHVGAFAFVVDQQKARQLLIDDDGAVFEDGQILQNAVFLAVAGHIADAQPARVAGAPHANPFAAHEDFAAVRGLRAENRALKKQLRGVARGKITAEQAEKTAAKASAKTTAEKAKAVEKKTEERISEKEAESDTGFHMFPF